MARSFSWSDAAHQYLMLYEDTLRRRKLSI